MKTKYQLLIVLSVLIFNILSPLLWRGSELFSQLPDTWTQKTNYGGTARFGATSFSIGSKGYIGTGNDGTFRKDFWEFDPSVGTNGAWSQKADFGGVARDGAVGFSIVNKGYIGTGYNAGIYYNDFWEYSPSPANSWTQKANFGGTARFVAVGFSIGNMGYIGTGYDNADNNDFWEFDPSMGTLGTWTPKANFLGVARESATGFSIGNKGYIGLGYSGGFLNDFWEYTPASGIGGGTWTQKANFGGTARQLATGFSIGAKGYIGVGNDGINQKNDFWEFDPSV